MHLNYNHLQYFWTVVREGSVVKAADALHVTPQTISGQLKLLDEAVGRPLFDRAGRRLVLSDMGKMIYDFADQIFSVGAELEKFVRNTRDVDRTTLNVGNVSSMPKLIVERIIAPAVMDDAGICIRCFEASLEQLLADLAVHRLDVVLSDQPLPGGVSLRAYNHPLGDSGLSFFSRCKGNAELRRKFPQSLDGARMLLPSKNSALRQKLDDWFESNGVFPLTVGEFDDSAVLKAFGEAGMGVFAAPTVIEAEVCRMYRMTVIGRAPDVKESFYAISSERLLRHDSVVAITDIARTDLFGENTARDR